MAKVDISKFIKKAEDALNRRNYELAIYSYTQALALQPDNVDAREKLRMTQTRAASETGGGGFVKFFLPFIKANLLSTLGKQEQAIIACEAALTANPSHIGAMKLLAKCAETAEMVELAAWQRREIADKHDQEDIDNLLELAELYKELERGKDAVECYSRAQKIDPDLDIEGDIRDAEAQMTSAIYNKGATDGARSILKDTEETEMLEMDPSKLRSDEDRLKYISYRLSHDAIERPDDHRIYLQLGDICYNMDDWEKGYYDGKKFLEKAHELSPADNSVLDRQGDFEIKRMKVEIREQQDKLQKSPDNAQLKEKVQKLSADRVAYEIAEYQRRVAAQPLKSNFHYRLGELYFQTKRNDEAVGELQLAAKDPKFKINALTMLGRAFLATGQFDMAISQFTRAREGQELFVKIRDALYYEAQAYEKKYDANPAVGAEQLKKSLAIYTKIYETDISFKDVKLKVPELQQRVKEAS